VLRLSRRTLPQAFLAIAGALALSLSGSAGVLASGGNDGGNPSGPQPNPTIAEQTANFTSAQLALYSSKLAAVHAFAQAKASGASPDICVPTCVPNYHYSYMTVIWEGSADCACGPATAAETFSTFTHYYGTTSRSLSQTESDMQVCHTGCGKGPAWYTCAVGTYRWGLTDELNVWQGNNGYVMQNIYSGTDVYNYTAVDVGGYNFPVTYDGETWGPTYGYPLDNYQGVNWGHYFPAYGYDQSGYVYVADPHYAYDHKYTGTAVYEFIANFTALSPQVVW